MIILNADMKPCIQGQIGEIYIRTPYRSLGYYNDPEMTSQRFVCNPFNKDKSDKIFKTGDTGKYLLDENIEFVGRVDNQIKIRGYRVELEEIEGEILKHAKVKQCAVRFFESDENHTEVLAAYYTSDSAINSQELQSLLKKILPDYMIPAHFTKQDTILLNKNGKTDYSQLPYPELAAHQITVLPDGPIEQQVLNIWKEILGLDSISTQDGFMKLGGDSMKIMSLISRVYTEFGIELPLESIFNSVTVQELANFIEKEQSNLEFSMASNQSLTESNCKSSILTENLENRVLLDITPFNDVYYRSCYFSALIPAIIYFGGDYFRLFCNDIMLFHLKDEQKQVRISTEYFSQLTTEEVLQSMGLEARENHNVEDLIEQIYLDISQNRPVILHIDCYYEPIRSDMYWKNHWSHYLIIVGFDIKARTIDVLEQNDLYSMTYALHKINNVDLIKMYTGAIKNFPPNKNLPSYSTVYPTGNKQIIWDCRQKYEQLLSKHMDKLDQSMLYLKKITEFMTRMLNNERLLKDNIDALILDVTILETSLIAEGYKYKKLYFMDKRIIELSEFVYQHWSMLKRILVKTQLNGNYQNLSLKKAASMITEAFENEIQIVEYLKDKTNSV
jgi:acyl carrier protein